ncbi:MAG TPA: hypothetical protein VEJ19_02170 [Nitrososphaerales archaeon]|nr:hypothetical protein [Nitrososphaerales archaeon]
MEGKRFGIGLAAGVLLALAVVTVSGGLGSSPLGTFAPAAAVSSTTTVASIAVTSSTTTVLSTVPSSATISSATTTTGGSGNSLNSNATYPYSVSTPSTTVTSTVSSISSTISSSIPASHSAGTSATSATNGTPYGSLGPSETNKPTQLANIAQQPIASKAEILAPVLVAFLLGAFLYRVAVQERERSSED